MPSKKAILSELISNRNQKFFATMVSISRRFSKLVGRSPTPKEEKWYNSLQYLDALKHCYTDIEVYGSPLYFDLLRLSFEEVMFLIDRIHLHDGYRFKDVITEDPVVMDVGAHIGVFPRYVLGEKPKSTVYALEPDIDNFNLLNMNLKGFNSALSFQKGVLNRKDSIEFFISKQIDWRSTLMTNPNFKDRPEFAPDEFSTSYEVEVTDIDSFVNASNIKRLELLKMTVAGEIEPLVLDGAIQTIEKFRPQVSMYVYPDNVQKVEEFFEKVGGYNQVPSPYVRPDNMPTDVRIFQSY